MYTKQMHERIRKVTKANYGKGLLLDNGFPLLRNLSVADVDELLDEIERLEEHLKKVASAYNLPKYY